MGAQDNYERLVARIGQLESALVAYSGGVDSTLLAVTAHAVLGERCAAVLATGDTQPAEEVAAARELAAELGLRLLEVETYELADPRFSANPPDRCYWCKGELFSLLARVADVNGFSVVVDGSNADDLADYRPGRQACTELGILSPLAEVGMGKADIRAIAKDLGLPNWDKPSMACLASRFPYGTPITEEALMRVAEAESVLRALGVSQSRVRAHGDLARVEVEPAELDRAWERREAISSAVRDAGFTWVALDLDGYRSGALNEALSEPDRAGRS